MLSGLERFHDFSFLTSFSLLAIVSLLFEYSQMIHKSVNEHLCRR